MSLKIIQFLVMLVVTLVILLGCKNENNQSSSRTTDSQEAQMPVNKNTIISAQVVFKSASGKSIDGNTAITADNILDYQPNPKIVSNVSDYLKKEGFNVEPTVGTSCAVTGKKSQFEKLFNVKILVTNKEGAMIQLENGLQTYEIPANSLPKDLAEEIAIITFSPPSDFGPSNY